MANRRKNNKKRKTNSAADTDAQQKLQTNQSSTEKDLTQVKNVGL